MSGAASGGSYHAHTMNNRLIVWPSWPRAALLLCPQTTWADGGLGPHLFDGPLSDWLPFLGIAGAALLGIFAFYALVSLWALLHLALLVLLVVGQLRGHHWRRGLQVVGLGLVASYLGLFALWRHLGTTSI